jgi:hypothetical protein
MNLSAFIDGLSRTTRNLPSLLVEWHTVDQDLRSHYADALVELIVSYESTRATAKSVGDVGSLQAAWSAFVRTLVQHAADLRALMDINPFELLTPASVSRLSGTPDAVPNEEADLPVAA